MRRLLSAAAGAAVVTALAACASEPAAEVRTPEPSATSETRVGADGENPASGAAATQNFTVAERGTFEEGWAMAFLPGTDHLLISERVGALQLRDQGTGEVREVSGVPEVHHAGQAGMHDVVPGPDFEETGEIYLSWVRPHEEGSQGVLGRATLDTETATLSDVEVLWEQTPAPGDGHYSLRLLVDGEHLFVTSGDRQLMDPAQRSDTNLGKVLRLTLDGEPAPDNPLAAEGGMAAEFWTTGHRNPLGIARDAEGTIWVSEMGPAGGDELNALSAGENYGWPEASMGEHYDGASIPDHTEGDDFHAPAEYWVPAISPGSLAVYDGELFAGWRDSALLGGLSGQALVRVELEGTDARQAARWDMGERIRAVDVAPDGAIWLLEDGTGGRLLELRPA